MATVAAASLASALKRSRSAKLALNRSSDEDATVSIWDWVAAPCTESAPTIRWVVLSIKASTAASARRPRLAAQLPERRTAPPNVAPQPRGSQSVFGAVLEDRREPLARAVEPVAKRLAALDQGFVEAIRYAAQPSHQVVAVQDHGVGQSRLTVVDAVDQSLRALPKSRASASLASIRRPASTRFGRGTRDRFRLSR